MQISKIKVPGVQNPIDIKDTTYQFELNDNTLKVGTNGGTKTAVYTPDLDGYASRVYGATAGHLAGLNASGDITDSGVAVGDLVKNAENITWAALKAKRDNSQLVPGQWYRITDYECTTTQENTQSAGHVFDIIVRADSTNTLNENAYAAKHAGDTYFANSKLEAWELKYTLDNIYWSLKPEEYITLIYGGTSRKAVYDGTEQINGTTYFRWLSNIKIGPSKEIYSISKNVSDTLYYYYSGSVGKIGNINSYVRIDASGKGTITWMEDEYNNECPYDFKNIQFKVGAKENAGTVADVFYYTFSVASGTNDATVKDHSLNGFYCYNNRMVKQITNSARELNFNVFRNTSITNECYNNSFGNGCYNNSFGNGCSSNSFGDYCRYNSFGNFYGNNSFGNGCSFNSFGNYCQYNSFGNYCQYNSFGNCCYNNSFGNYCQHNSFLKGYSYYIIIENGNQYITLTSTQTTSSSSRLHNIKICQGVNNTTTTKTISHDTVNDTFQTVYQPANSQVISV